jgi:hypothetical protein
VQLPGQVRAAAIMALVQAAGLLAVAAVLVVKIAGGGYADAGRAWSDAGFALLGALGLVFAARALSYLRSAVRTPLLVVEFLALPVGYGLFQAGRVDYGVPVVLGALAVIVLLLSRPARAALDRS